MGYRGVAYAPGNQPPVVNLGADLTVAYPSQATLDATVTDDGLPDPPGTVTVTWTKQSGPGTVTFGNIHAVDTTANFSSLGTYVLRMTADDGELTSYEEMTVTVSQQSNQGRRLTPVMTRQSRCQVRRILTVRSQMTVYRIHRLP